MVVASNSDLKHSVKTDKCQDSEKSQEIEKSQKIDKSSKLPAIVPEGYSTRRWLNGGYDGENSLLVPNGCKSGTNENACLNRKKARFMVRAFKGVECGLAKNCRFRWFVLTESDEAIDSRKKFGREFHNFIRWLRKVHKIDLQYIVVEHRQGDKKRSNYHVLTYGSDKLPLRVMREYWESHYLSHVTGMAEIVDIRKSVKYLCAYVSDGDKFVRSFNSQGWIFRGWQGFSKKYKAEYGRYPDNELMAVFSLTDKRNLEFNLLCCLHGV
jgi:hypothetical protein